MSKYSTSNLYEVVSGQILLGKRSEFFRLHDEVLLPIMNKIGIKPVMLLITEIGRYARFLDIYEYRNFEDYERKTDLLLAHPSVANFHEQVGQCIHGSITIELMRNLPYAEKWRQ